MSHVDERTLHALVDDALDSAERDKVQSHLSTCGDCARRFAEATAMARQVHTLLGALDEPPARVRIDAPVRQEAVTPITTAPAMRRRVFTLRRVALAASLMLVAGVSYELGKTGDAAATSRALASAKQSATSARHVTAAPSVVDAPDVQQGFTQAAPPAAMRAQSGPRAESDVPDSRPDREAVTRNEVQAPAAGRPVTPLPMPTPQVAVASDAAGQGARDRQQAPSASPSAAQEQSATLSVGVSDSTAPSRRQSAGAADAAVTGQATAQQRAVRTAAPKMARLSGYTSVEEESVPSVTRRRYVSTAGTPLLLVIVQAALTQKAGAASDAAPEFVIRTSGGTTVVRWTSGGRSYELTGALSPDSLVKLATQLH